ncbi:DVU0772 family protein [Lawsonia intracellularis]|uniref:DVU0772 family protein n=1 Tax=Lawsonia intracellularis TaxID=29546 RepID=UPI0009F985FC|nr:hypothetical protein [Lawsonia intracellularis]
MSEVLYEFYTGLTMTQGNDSALSSKSPLKAFSNQTIDWDLSPEKAVTLHLEYGNNNWHVIHTGGCSGHDSSVYFIVDTYSDPIQVRLIRRNFEMAEHLISIPLPDTLVKLFQKEYGNIRGVFEPLPEIKEWLRIELGQ